MGTTVPAIRADDDDGGAAALHALARFTRATRAREEVLVRRAQVAGAQWRQVAGALGVSRRQARRRYR